MDERVACERVSCIRDEEHELHVRHGLDLCTPACEARNPSRTSFDGAVRRRDSRAGSRNGR
eukprot:6177840-Pleurochrysis_carterae.AAC.1